MRAVAGLILVLALFSSVPAETSRYIGRASIRIDDRGRVVVLLDEGVPDGLYERIWIADPRRPLPDRPAPIEAYVEIVYDGQDGILRVTSVNDASVQMSFDTAAPGPGGDSSYLVRWHARQHAQAIVFTSDHNRNPDTDGILTVDMSAADREALRRGEITPETIPLIDCTHGRPDSDCESGGLGSTHCAGSCGGFSFAWGLFSIEGQRVEATCGIGTYCCGYCKDTGLFSAKAIAVCRPDYVCN